MQLLLLARAMGLLTMGTVALDGTKIHVSASKHSALCYEHAGKIEAQLKVEVAELLAKAEAADQSAVPGLSIPGQPCAKAGIGARIPSISAARAR